MHGATLATFGAYLALMLGLGAWFARRSATPGDYLLGGRTLNPFVTALSAQASDMSGWLLMGLPGALYLSGLGELWMVFGLLAGTVLNWTVVAPRLRRDTEARGAITLNGWLERRFGTGDLGLLSGLAGLATLFFFTVYAASGLVAAGLLFERVLELDYRVAVAVGAAVVLGYTALGGFLAVCWTDLVQGLLMLLALLVVPTAAALGFAGTPPAPPEGVAVALPGSGAGPGGALAALSAAAWGLGYVGQPHILVRFMAIGRPADLGRARGIALGWVFLCLAGAVAVGLVGASHYAGGLQNPERVFLRMVADVFDPWTGGVLLSAILAAIMSTIDSQLLVSAGILSEDLVARGLWRDASPRALVAVGRAAVVAITVVAAVLALDRESTVLGLVRYAWGGLGASLGPLVVGGLFWRRATYRGAVAGLVAGASTSIAWNVAGLGDVLYEILPGFAAGTLALAVVSLLDRAPGAVQRDGARSDGGSHGSDTPSP